jgi:hypothetical protein
MGFLTEGTPFRGMGMAFTLLRAVQLLACCDKGVPNLYIQAKPDLYIYLQAIGFSEELSEEYHKFETDSQPEISTGYLWRVTEGMVLMECTFVVR